MVTLGELILFPVHNAGPLHPLHMSFWPLVFAHVLLSAALGTTVLTFQVIWTRPVFPQCPPLPGTRPTFCLP